MRFSKRGRMSLMAVTKGKIYRMSQERQRASFALVLVFMAVFGMIVLAEVLNITIDTNRGGHGGQEELLYDDDDGELSISDKESSLSGGGDWETPKPLPGSGIAGNEATDKGGSVRLSLKRHQEEMEKLIRNISDTIRNKALSPSSSSRPTKTDPSKPLYTLPDEPYPMDFDFELKRHLGYNGRWLPVNGTSHKFFVYSAFYDDRDPKRPVVKVIGVTHTTDWHSDTAYCRMYFREEGDGVKIRHVKANINIIRENWNLRFSACFVTCPLFAGHIPASVSVISRKTINEKKSSSQSADLWGNRPASSVGNQLVVNNAIKETDADAKVKSRGGLGVCVKPVFRYNKTAEIIEFLEVNRILGVGKFTLYNLTMSPEVSCALQRYIDAGLVEVLPWQGLDLRSGSEIRTQGMFAALNDCLYRHMYTSEYLMLIDLDEVIVPHGSGNSTIKEMLEFVASGRATTKNGQALKLPPTISSYSFQNAFFYLQFPDDEESRLDQLLRLRVLSKTRRRTKFNPQKQRSKYVCVPRNVNEAGNHFIWEYSQGSNVNVPTSVGFLHHYRVCEFGGDSCVRSPNQVDRTLPEKYGKSLLRNVGEAVRDLKPKCPAIFEQGIFSSPLVHPQTTTENNR